MLLELDLKLIDVLKELFLGRELNWVERKSELFGFADDVG